MIELDGIQITHCCALYTLSHGDVRWFNDKVVGSILSGRVSCRSSLEQDRAMHKNATYMVKIRNPLAYKGDAVSAQCMVICFKVL